MKRLFKWVLSLTMLISLFTTPVLATEYTRVDVGYQVKTSEWFDYAWGGALGGSEGVDPLTALEINLDSAPYGAGIEYRVYTQSGWLDWTPSFGIAGNGEAILGVQIQLTDFDYANVYYQTYRKGLGWGTWQSNGSTSGQLSAENPITGIRVKVDEIGVEYQSNVGGTEMVLRHNNETQGSGLIYTVKMGLISSAADDKLEYRAYYKNSGWTNWVSNMTVLGSERGGDYITALEARLVGLDQYHVSIQPQVNGTWWDYAYDGQTAGNASSDASALTAYRVKIEKDAPKETVATSTPVVEEETVVEEIIPTVLTDDNGNLQQIATTPNISNIKYSAGVNATDVDYTEVRILSAYSALTIDGNFDDNPAGITIGINDQFTAQLYTLASDNRIQIPDTFSEYGDNVVDDDQFEVYYGTYVDGVFTVTNMRDSEFEYLDSEYWPEPALLGTETHTLIVYDNDDRYIVESEGHDQEDYGYTIYYAPETRPLGFTTTNDFSSGTEKINIENEDYTIEYNTNIDSNGYIYDYTMYYNYDLDAYSKSLYKKYTPELNTDIDVSGSNMILDGFVLEGLYYETGWSVVNDAGTNYLEYSDGYQPVVANPAFATDSNDKYRFVLTSTIPMNFYAMRNSNTWTSSNVPMYLTFETISNQQTILLNESYITFSTDVTVHDDLLFYVDNYSHDSVPLTNDGDFAVGDRVDVYQGTKLVGIMYLDENTIDDWDDNPVGSNYMSWINTYDHKWYSFGFDEDKLFDTNTIYCDNCG